MQRVKLFAVGSKGVKLPCKFRNSPSAASGANVGTTFAKLALSSATYYKEIMKICDSSNGKSPVESFY